MIIATVDPKTQRQGQKTVRGLRVVEGSLQVSVAQPEILDIIMKTVQELMKTVQELEGWWFRKAFEGVALFIGTQLSSLYYDASVKQLTVFQSAGGRKATVLSELKAPPPDQPFHIGNIHKVTADPLELMVKNGLC